MNTAKAICSLFGLELRPMNSATFAGTAVECVNANGMGTHGHIGFFTNSIERAISYFEGCGIRLNIDGAKRDKNGRITCVYLADEIAGFAFHVVCK